MDRMNDSPAVQYARWCLKPDNLKAPHYVTGVFDAYTPEMRACRSSHIITGLPDAYGRGRIRGV